jgi:hypothetical protein
MRLKPTTKRVTQPALFLGYLSLMPIVVAMLSAGFLRYADFHIARASDPLPGQRPSVVLRIEDDGVVINGLHTSLSALPAALHRADPPFGSTAMVSAAGGTVGDLDEIRKILRAGGLGALFVDP